MNKSEKTWDGKIKLILNELENKMNVENVQETKKHGSRQSKTAKCGTLKAGKKKYKTKEEWKKANFRQEVILHVVMSAAFLLATVALIQGIAKVLPDSISVSNTVNGRELPIYCVETDKPQIALSFDAAWGNEDTAKILEILRKHNVKVTFFMTGGWVEAYPDDVKAILADGD